MKNRFMVINALLDFENKIILDVGCGTGIMGAVLLNNYSCWVFGIDKNKPHLELARKKGLLINNADLEKDNLPYQNEFFDVVLCCETIEHIINYDFTLMEIYRVLKKSGVLIITTPNLYAIQTLIKMFMFGKKNFLIDSYYRGHTTMFSFSKIKKTLIKNGFLINKTIYINRPPSSVLGVLLKIFCRMIPYLGNTMIIKAYKKTYLNRVNPLLFYFSSTRKSILN